MIMRRLMKLRQRNIFQITGITRQPPFIIWFWKNTYGVAALRLPILPNTRLRTLCPVERSIRANSKTRSSLNSIISLKVVVVRRAQNPKSLPLRSNSSEMWQSKQSIRSAQCLKLLQLELVMFRVLRLLPILGIRWHQPATWRRASIAIAKISSFKMPRFSSRATPSSASTRLCMICPSPRCRVRI